MAKFCRLHFAKNFHDIINLTRYYPFHKITIRRVLISFLQKAIVNILDKSRNKWMKATKYPGQGTETNIWVDWNQILLISSDKLVLLLHKGRRAYSCLVHDWRLVRHLNIIKAPSNSTEGSYVYHYRVVSLF